MCDRLHYGRQIEGQCCGTWGCVSYHLLCVDPYSPAALHLFGKEAFFQPYLPLQQVDTLRTRSWLTGTTNQIVTQQRDCKYDLLVNVSFKTSFGSARIDNQIENVSFTFSDPKMERIVALTAADRRWMDDVVRTVEESWGMVSDLVLPDQLRR